MYRYCLEPYKGMSSRYRCPQCGKAKVFTRYIDTQTGEHLSIRYGKCERVNKCGYWLNPYKDGFVNKGDTEIGIQKYPNKSRLPDLQQGLAPSTVPDEVFLKSRQSYDHNCFVEYLRTLFSNDVVRELIASYHIGTSKHWPGATVFWQIDGLGQIRSGKIMLYCARNGHRVKSPYNHITWAHKVCKLEHFRLEQCLFGEHLLPLHPLKPVAIVESEKTAIIASAYLPDFIWLAVGSLNNLSEKRCLPLAGRKAFLFPDLGAYHAWAEKAAKLSDICHFAVSDILERIATEQDRKDGLDIADYLIRYPLQQFQRKGERASVVKFRRSVN
ncbi:DUF6371 domain-containing protein [Cesiribacter sp. SM1]|uniref:DUF6371 domain-containing protein n=1 Tax=Cesiribacter sp. SM1 TaxID=2861196 RepID=UPI001CD26F63|nr:DUF6371 domain-containing protein [Cesiribacter sp. SM1]